MKTLEIIIVSYNSLEWLKKTLDSLNSFYLPYSKYNVVITLVDNASADETVPYVAKCYPKINMLLSSENLGFSAGNNLALKRTKADFVMLLNSDMELTEKSNFDDLLDYLEKDKNIGIITPKINLSDGRIDKACHRGEPGLLDAFFYFAGFEKIFPKIKLFTKYHMLCEDFSKIHEVDAVTGACMLMRAESLKNVGLFDERFFMYSEDMDLCRRFRQKGYKNIYYPFAEIIHHKYKSGLASKNDKIKKQMSDHFYGSFLLYYDKYYSSKWYYGLAGPFLRLFVYLKKKI